MYSYGAEIHCVSDCDICCTQSVEFICHNASSYVNMHLGCSIANCRMHAAPKNSTDPSKHAAPLHTVLVGPAPLSTNLTPFTQKLTNIQLANSPDLMLALVPVFS